MVIDHGDPHRETMTESIYYTHKEWKYDPHIGHILRLINEVQVVAEVFVDEFIEYAIALSAAIENKKYIKMSNGMVDHALP